MCAVPPSIEDAAGDTVVSATVNSRTLLSCNVIGLPRPDVRWLKDARAIPAASAGSQTGARYVITRPRSLLENESVPIQLAQC